MVLFHPLQLWWTNTWWLGFGESPIFTFSQIWRWLNLVPGYQWTRRGFRMCGNLEDLLFQVVIPSYPIRIFLILFWGNEFETFTTQKNQYIWRLHIVPKTFTFHMDATWLSLWYQWPQTTLLIRPCPPADLPQLSLPPGFREAGSILGMCPSQWISKTIPNQKEQSVTNMSSWKWSFNHNQQVLARKLGDVYLQSHYAISMPSG